MHLVHVMVRLFSSRFNPPRIGPLLVRFLPECSDSRPRKYIQSALKPSSFTFDIDVDYRNGAKTAFPNCKSDYRNVLRSKVGWGSGVAKLRLKRNYFLELMK